MYRAKFDIVSKDPGDEFCCTAITDGDDSLSYVLAKAAAMIDKIKDHKLDVDGFEIITE